MAFDIELAEVVEAVADAEAQLSELSHTSVLPEQPDRAWVNQWLRRTHLGYWDALTAAAAGQ